MCSCDRGLHNRGAFGRARTLHGVYLRFAALESPEQIGRGETHGKIWKKTMKATVKTCNITGKRPMKFAAAINSNVKNDMGRKGGIAPSAWVAPCLPGEAKKATHPEGVVPWCGRGSVRKKGRAEGWLCGREAAREEGCAEGGLCGRKAVRRDIVFKVTLGEIIYA